MPLVWSDDDDDNLKASSLIRTWFNVSILETINPENTHYPASCLSSCSPSHLKPAIQSALDGHTLAGMSPVGGDGGDE